MKTRILVVEDEKDISELMALHLKREGHEVVGVENGEEALTILQGPEEFDLVVLDWMLPGLSGLDVCKRLRARPEENLSGMPIFMVTARAHTSDIVLGLEMGADDYVTKPFDIPIFLARVRALLRRSQSVPAQEFERLEVGELSVDIPSHAVSCAKKQVQLTPSEFKLLVALLQNRGRVLTRDRLIDMVQGEEVSVVDRTVDTHVFGLRKKLGKCSDVIETIRGVGYRVKVE